MKDVSVVIPACNEAEFIRENIKNLENFLKSNYKSYEIVVSEDGSTDGTDQILRSMSINGDIIHLHSKKRLGKGLALNRALSASSGKRVFMVDADFPVSLEYISKMLGYLEQSDIVIGSRMMKKSVIKRSLLRSAASLSYNTLVRLLFRTGVRDHQCGVKAFRREVLSDVIPQIESNNFFWDTEFLVKAKRKGYRILEIPITWYDREKGKSKVSISRESWSMGKNMIRLWCSFNRQKIGER